MCFSGPYVMNILHTARIISMESALFQLSSLYFSNTENYSPASFLRGLPKEREQDVAILLGS